MADAERGRGLAGPGRCSATWPSSSTWSPIRPCGCRTIRRARRSGSTASPWTNAGSGPPPRFSTTARRSPPRRRGRPHRRRDTGGAGPGVDAVRPAEDVRSCAVPGADGAGAVVLDGPAARDFDLARGDRQGAGRRASGWRLDEACGAWDRRIDIDINLTGVLNGITAAYDRMMAQRHGHVANISSIYGTFPVLGAGVYGAALDDRPAWTGRERRVRDQPAARRVDQQDHRARDRREPHPLIPVRRDEGDTASRVAPIAARPLVAPPGGSPTVRTTKRAAPARVPPAGRSAGGTLTSAEAQPRVG